VGGSKDSTSKENVIFFSYSFCLSLAIGCGFFSVYFIYNYCTGTDGHFQAGRHICDWISQESLSDPTKQQVLNAYVNTILSMPV
jgi:hypothetical protein